MQAILGIKKSQTQKFRTDGKRIPVTVVEVNSNPVIAIKSMDKDGYFAVQLGYGTQKKPNKPYLGHTKGAALKAAPRFLREVKFSGETTTDELPKVGDFIDLATVLQPGDVIDVIGVAKGKGFAGGVKRYHFQGGPKTHGQSDRHRAPGSIGSGTTPGRVYKGKRMAGKMGGGQITVRNLVVAAIDGTTLYIKGLVPGTLNTLLKITKKGEDKNFAPLLGFEEKAEDALVEAQVTEQSVVKEEEITAEKTENAAEVKEPEVEKVSENASTPSEEVVSADKEKKTEVAESLSEDVKKEEVADVEVSTQENGEKQEKEEEK